MTNAARETRKLEANIVALLADEEYSGHPLRDALGELWGRYEVHVSQIERVTSISDGYQSAMRDRNHSLLERYDKQVRHLQKIVRISDQYQKMLHDLNEALKVASLHDPLTNLPNRRLMIERLAGETAAAQRGRKPFAIAVLDVDHFKSINDDWGHEAGDNALVAIANEITHSLRAYDVCARWGGEEFLILLPETEPQKALEIAERLLVKIHTLELPGLPPSRKATISIGIACHTCNSDFSQTIKRADDALYQAKREGRNRAVLAA